MKEPFDYSIVPYTFGLCAAEECPRATTCLRHIALEYARGAGFPVNNESQPAESDEKCL